MKDYNKVKGALFGVAIGDALGAPLEFMSAEEIQQNHGTVTEMIGGGVWTVKPGETTDDTAMTIAVALGIAEAPKNPVPLIGANFLQWFDSQPKDIGTNTRNVLTIAKDVAIRAGGYEALTEADWHHISYHHGQSDGNGTLMRTVYPALYYPEDVLAEKVKTIAEMTHCSTMSSFFCTEYCTAIYHAIRGEEVKLTITENDCPPTGYVRDTYVNSVQAVLQTSSFEDAIINAVNRGGDTDTIGAVTGGLAGAMYGYDEIPARWVEALDPELRNTMDELVEIAMRKAV